MSEPQGVLAPNDDAMWKFVMWWFRRCTRGVIEIGWTLPGDGGIRHFRRFELEDEAILPFVVSINKVPGNNVYIRISTIDPSAPEGHTLDIHVWQTPGLFADLDTLAQTEAAKKVASILRPLAFGVTGRIPHLRMQPYFLLDEPLEDGEQVRELNRRLVKLLGSDPAVINPSRLMRLPGTIAWPKKPGRVAELTEFILPEDGRPASYPLDFVQLQLQVPKPEAAKAEEDWGPAPVGPHQATAHVSLESELLARVKAGDQWHQNLLRLIARWVGTGLSDALILTLAGSLTLTGYTVAQTLAEMRTMLAGARKKWNVPDPATEVEVADNEPPTPLDLFSGFQSPAPELTAEHVPAVVWRYASDTSIRMGVDASAVALACLTALAAVMSDVWRLQPKVRDRTWTECARLWAALVGDPSILKSPVVQAATKPTERLDATARRLHEDEMAVYEVEHAAWKAAKDKTVPEPKAPKLARFLVENATIEALSEVLRDDAKATMRVPAKKVMCRQDEMSEWFANMDRYKAGGRGGGDRGAFLRSYNGGRFTMDRIGRGSFSISNWSVCFLGGVQPGPIKKIAREADDDGLLQRFMFVVPWGQLAGEDRDPDLNALREYDDLFDKLIALHPPKSLAGEDKVVVLHGDAQAHREVVELLARVMGAQRDARPQLQSTLGKWPGLFARLCLTFHLIELAQGGPDAPYPLVVSEATARKVSLFMREILLPHLFRAHDIFYSSVREGDMQWVASHILEHGLKRITVRELAHAHRPFRAPEARPDLEITMLGLVACGWLEPEAPTGAAASTMVRPIAWKVNPTVHSLFAAKAEAVRSDMAKRQKDMKEAYRQRRLLDDAAEEPSDE